MSMSPEEYKSLKDVEVKLAELEAKLRAIAQLHGGTDIERVYIPKPPRGYWDYRVVKKHPDTVIEDHEEIKRDST